MRHHGVSLVELVVVAAILAVLMGGVYMATTQLNRQSSHASVGLTQVQEALLFLESVRMELSSIVMNPMADGSDHRGNSFTISEPNGSSIQFVTERFEGGFRKRHLIYYQARPKNGRDSANGILMTKKVWSFDQLTAWEQEITYPPGWPAAWIGPLEESAPDRWRDLGLLDVRWQYLVPEEPEGRVFFRVKLVLGVPGKGRTVPLSTLIAVQTPDLPRDITACPSYFSGCFDPARPDCYCAPTAGPSPVPPVSPR